MACSTKYVIRLTIIDVCLLECAVLVARIAQTRLKFIASIRSNFEAESAARKKHSSQSAPMFRHCRKGTPQFHSTALAWLCKAAFITLEALSSGAGVAKKKSLLSTGAHEDIYTHGGSQHIFLEPSQNQLTYTTSAA
eukprot:5569447-Pleurochrysis_carterae.AAC.1